MRGLIVLLALLMAGCSTRAPVVMSNGGFMDMVVRGDGRPARVKSASLWRGGIWWSCRELPEYRLVKSMEAPHAKE